MARKSSNFDKYSVIGAIMKKFFKDCFTGPDGVTYDPARILWFIGIVAFLCFTGHWVYTGHEFNMVNFGIAFSSLLVAGGIGVKVKESSEPPAPVAAVTSAFIPPAAIVPIPAFVPPPPLTPSPPTTAVAPAPASLVADVDVEIKLPKPPRRPRNNQ